MIDEYRIYAMLPAPPKWELQECIAAYLKEKDNQFLSWFLHYYVNTLNANVQKYMRQFFIPEHFADMKQAYVIGTLKAFENYDISLGVPFVLYKERCAERKVLDYIRSVRTGYKRRALRNMPSCERLWRYGTNMSAVIPTKRLKR